jgi:site-specific DNA-methyltransferase (adenine-specific)
MSWTNGMWTFNGESKKKIGHPAPFTKELPYRAVKLFSYVGDVVFDPFSGSGTTALVAAMNKRIEVGLDIRYRLIILCKLAKKRILQEIDMFTFY